MRRLLFCFLPEGKDATLILFHRNVPFKNSAIPDHQALCGDVADDRTGRLDFQPFVGLNVGHDFALDKDRSGGDLPLDRGLLADRDMRLSDDFSFDLAVNRGLAVELELAVDFGAWTEVGANVRR